MLFFVGGGVKLIILKIFRKTQKNCYTTRDTHTKKNLKIKEFCSSSNFWAFNIFFFNSQSQRGGGGTCMVLLFLSSKIVVSWLKIIDFQRWLFGSITFRSLRHLTRIRLVAILHLLRRYQIERNPHDFCWSNGLVDLRCRVWKDTKNWISIRKGKVCGCQDSITQLG